MAVTSSSHSLEAAWWFFSAFEHCATRSDEIDDTSSAVTSERDNGTSLMLASLRFLNTFGEQRHRRSRLHAPLSYRGPSWWWLVCRGNCLSRSRPATHPRCVNTSLGTNRCRSIRGISRYTTDRMIQCIRQRLRIAVGGSLWNRSSFPRARFYNFLNNDFITRYSITFFEPRYSWLKLNEYLFKWVFVSLNSRLLKEN